MFRFLNYREHAHYRLSINRRIASIGLLWVCLVLISYIFESREIVRPDHLRAPLPKPGHFAYRVQRKGSQSSPELGENWGAVYCTLTALIIKLLEINGAGEGNRTLVSIRPAPVCLGAQQKCRHPCLDHSRLAVTGRVAQPAGRRLAGREVVMKVKNAEHWWAAGTVTGSVSVWPTAEPQPRSPRFPCILQGCQSKKFPVGSKNAAASETASANSGESAKIVANGSESKNEIS